MDQTEEAFGVARGTGCRLPRRRMSDFYSRLVLLVVIIAGGLALLSMVASQIYRGHLSNIASVVSDRYSFDVTFVPIRARHLYHEPFNVRLLWGSTEGHHTILKRRNSTSTRKHKSTYEVCLQDTCNKDLSFCTDEENHMSNEETMTCKMCYPEKDVYKVDEHCKQKDSSEWTAFYTVCGLFFAVLLISSCALSCKHVRRARQRRANRKSEAPPLVIPLRRESYLPNMTEIPEEEITQIALDNNKPWYSRMWSKNSKKERTISEKPPAETDTSEHKRWYRAILPKGRRSPGHSTAERGLSPTKVRTRESIAQPESGMLCISALSIERRVSIPNRPPLEPLHPNESGSFFERPSREFRGGENDSTSMLGRTASLLRRGQIDRIGSEDDSIFSVDRPVTGNARPRFDSRVSVSESVNTLERAALGRRPSRVVSSGVEARGPGDVRGRNVRGSDENVRSPS